MVMIFCGALKPFYFKWKLSKMEWIRRHVLVRSLANRCNTQLRKPFETNSALNENLNNCDATLNFILENAIIKNDKCCIIDTLHRLDSKFVHPRLLVSLKVEETRQNMNISDVVDFKLRKIFVEDTEKIIRFLNNVVQLAASTKNDNSGLLLKNDALILQKDSEAVHCEWLHPKYWWIILRNFPQESNHRWKLLLYDRYLLEKCDSITLPIIRELYKNWSHLADKNLYLLNPLHDSIDLTVKFQNMNYQLKSCHIDVGHLFQSGSLIRNSSIEKIEQLNATRQLIISMLENHISKLFDETSPSNIVSLVFEKSDTINLTHLIANSILNSSKKSSFVTNFTDDLYKTVGHNIECYYYYKWKHFYRMDYVINCVDRMYKILSDRITDNKPHLLPRLIWTGALCRIFGCTQLIEPFPMPALIKYELTKYIVDTSVDIFFKNDTNLFYKKIRNQTSVNILPSNTLKVSLDHLSKLEQSSDAQNGCDTRFLPLFENHISHQIKSFLSSYPIWLSYYTLSHMSNYQPFIKTAGTFEYNCKLQLLNSTDSKDIIPVLDSLSKLNSTALVINTNIQKIVQLFLKSPKKFKEFDNNRNRPFVKQNNIQQLLKLNNKPFYLKYRIDFRGRAYSDVDLNTFADVEMLSGLLEFACKKPLGDTGLKWLKILFTSLYLSPCDRNNDINKLCKFCDENMPLIKKTVQDPLKYSWWQLKKHPWKILAVCYELVNAKNDIYYESSLPIFFDGSCNMFQHLAAFCNDNILKKHVNFHHTTDCNISLYDYLCEKAWTTIDVKIPTFDGEPLFTRNFFKTILILAMQNASDQAITSFVKKYFTDETNFKYGVVIAELVSKIQSLLISTMPKVYTFKEWLFNATNQITSHVGSIEWSSPIGFPISQNYFVINSHHMYPSNLHPICMYNTTQNPHNITPNKNKHNSSILYNLVHSLDATHMMLISLNCIEKNINVIQKHDSFGTHLCDADTINKIIRDQFVRMYENNKPYKKFISDLASIKNPKNGHPILKPMFIEDSAIINDDTQNLNSILSSYNFFHC